MTVESINKHRFTREPLERRFVEAWNSMNENNKLLRFILDRSFGNRGDYHPSELEQEVAVTIIQWLGSPVGQGFIKDVERQSK